MSTRETGSARGLISASDIAPAKSPAYSPNLHRWVAGAIRAGYPVTGLRVYRVRHGSGMAKTYAAGTPFIGWIEGDGTGDLFGSHLIGVLCNGTGEDRFCYPVALNSLTTIVDFWPQYLAIGRCAIDPAHAMWPNAERFTFAKAGRTRACNWCGLRQHRHTIKRVVRDTVWSNA